jgi:hypothetical protein
MKTLLLALISPSKSKGTREGSIRGLIGVGKEAVRKGLIEGGGAKVVGSECAPGERGPLIDAVVVKFPSHPFPHNFDVLTHLIRMHSGCCDRRRICPKLLFLR